MADPDEILLGADERMDGAVQALKRELNGIRTGRAHASLIETLVVDYYGAATPLKQLGTINAPEADFKLTGGANMTGAAIVNTYTSKSSNVGFHYDEGIVKQGPLKVCDYREL